MAREPIAEGELPRRRTRRFQDLMRHRVQHILLVASLYDSFILTEDGHLNEAILRQFLDLNLSHNPDVSRVSTGGEAVAAAAEERRFDMILASLHVGDMNGAEMARRVRAAGRRSR
jgi:CheY-like chemotaxis protein